MESLCACILERVREGVYLIDRDRRISYWNPAAERISGFRADEIVGRYCAENILTHIDEQGRLLCNDSCPVVRTMAEGREWEESVYMHHKDGHRVPVTVRALPILDAEGKITGAVEIFSDNSSEHATRRKIEELEKLALVDPLTNLPNRRYIEMTLRSRLQELERYRWAFGVLFADIDDFKKINDTFGHTVGDQVLKMVSNTLVKSSRGFDLWGRFGGEEFVGVVRNVDHEGLYSVGNRSRMLVENSYLSIGDGPVRVTISAGGTLASPQDTPDTLVERADELMYQSKKEGKNRLRLDRGEGV